MFNSEIFVFKFSSKFSGSLVFFSVGLFSVLVKILVFDLEKFQRGYQH